jgi:hypothetical protein
MVHVSRLAEEIVLWMSQNFGFIDLADRYCTGSSIMPQKRNPDVAELARGKTGRVVGHLMGLLTLMKGQPLTYNKDNQEDKEPLFDTVDTLADTLRIMAEMVGGIDGQADAMERAALKGYATATDLADYLVKKGLPFRDAHEVVAHAVKIACSAASTWPSCRWPNCRQLERRHRRRRAAGADAARLAGTRARCWAAPRRRRCAARPRWSCSAQAAEAAFIAVRRCRPGPVQQFSQAAQHPAGFAVKQAGVRLHQTLPDALQHIGFGDAEVVADGLRAFGQCLCQVFAQLVAGAELAQRPLQSATRIGMHGVKGRWDRDLVFVGHARLYRAAEAALR